MRNKNINSSLGVAIDAIAPPRSLMQAHSIIKRDVDFPKTVRPLDEMRDIEISVKDSEVEEVEGAKFAENNEKAEISPVKPAINVKKQTQEIVNWLNSKNQQGVKIDVDQEHSIINQCIGYLRKNPSELASLVRRLSKSSGDYGSNSKEVLSKKSQKLILNRWLEALVFKHSVGEFIARRVVAASMSESKDFACNFTIKQIYSLIEKSYPRLEAKRI
ncbi:hypothetical protein ABK905_25385 [Acerihabitans sp. KWT182]|uniref:Uncharacterized protein n=1 Tax=Acerihabitans sp. KWT182 TaxID=3157919 RepID=A0AAU7QB64_9GAMM